MKNYKEVAENVFARSSEILKRKKQNRVVMFRTLSTCFSCLVVVLTVYMMFGIGVMRVTPDSKDLTSQYITIDGDDDVKNTSDNNGNSNKNPDTGNENNDKTPDTDNDNNGKEPDIGDDNDEKDPNDDNDNFLPNDNVVPFEWNGKYIDSSLFERLKIAAPNDVIKIYMIPKTDYNFVYNIKTLSEYIVERNAMIDLSQKLEILVKDGDSLKYGEALYTTGTPTGEKWLKEHYDETVAFYGSEIIEKYIVDGEFLIEALYEDEEALQNNIKKLEIEFQKACTAYVEYAINNAKEQLSMQNIQSTISANCNYLIFNISVTDFANMQINNVSNYYFSVFREGASDSGLDTSDDDIQAPQDAIANPANNEWKNYST